MDETTWVTAASVVGGVIGSLVTAGGGIIGVWLTWRKVSHRIQQESDASALEHYEGVIRHYSGEIERLTRQSERQDRQIVELAEVLQECRGEHLDAWASIDELYGWVESYHRTALEMARRGRRDVSSEVPPPPPRPTRPDSLEHRARTAEQTARIVREIGRGGPDQTPPKESTT